MLERKGKGTMLEKSIGAMMGRKGDGDGARKGGWGGGEGRR